MRKLLPTLALAWAALAHAQTPTLTSTSPNSSSAGCPGFALTAIGTNFGPSRTRDVLGELVKGQCGNRDIGKIFPGHTIKPRKLIADA